MTLKRKKGFDKKEIFPLALIVLMFAVAIFSYPHLPEKMPVHWDSEGNIDGYGSRFTGTFLLPIITLVIYLVFAVIPYIAVYKKNIKSFYFYYFGFKLSFVLFFTLLYIVSLLPNFGFDINMTLVIMPMIAVLIYLAGILMTKSKRNYFIGIRTPWTLASDEVWNRTNKLGGTVFKLLAPVVLILAFVPKGVIIMTIILILSVIGILIYSYRIYSFSM